MKNLLYFLLAGLLFTSCNTVTDSEAIERNSEMVELTLPSLEGKHCFLKTVAQEPFVSGSDTIRLIDSTVIQLDIKGEQVTGIFNWMPAEVDQTLGTLTGTIDGSTISAVYNYTTEGFNESEEKILEIRNNEIAIKSGELEENADGVLVFKDVSKAVFIEKIARVECE